MIAKYDGKCALTNTPIIAGETEIGMVGRMAVLAEYASDEALAAWFERQVAQYLSLVDEWARLREIERGEYPKGAEKVKAEFLASWHNVYNPATNKFATPSGSVEWLKSKVLEQVAMVDRQRERVASMETN